MSAPAMRWVRVTASIARPAIGAHLPRQVRAYQSAAAPGLVITQDWHLRARVPLEAWTVTHERSGKRVVTCSRLRIAATAALRLATLGNWDRAARTIQRDRTFRRCAEAMIWHILEQDNDWPEEDHL